MVRSEYDTRLFAIRRVNELEAYLAEVKKRPNHDTARKVQLIRSTEGLLNYWRTKL